MGVIGVEESPRTYKIGFIYVVEVYSERLI